MGFRFRKSVRLAPGFRINLSASRRGMTTGISGGVKGARLSFNSRGDQQTTFGLPGTGLSYVRRIRRGSFRSWSIRSVGGWMVAGVAVLALLAFCTHR